MTERSAAVPISNGAAILTSWTELPGYQTDREPQPKAHLLIVKGTEMSEEGVMPAVSISLGMADITVIHALLRGYFDGLREKEVTS